MEFLGIARPFIGHEQDVILVLCILMVANTIAGLYHASLEHNFQWHKVISQTFNKILTLAIIIPVFIFTKQKNIVEANCLVMVLMLAKELISAFLHIFKFNFKTYNSLFDALKNKEFTEED